MTGKELAQKARQAGILPAKPPGTARYSYYLFNRGHGRFATGALLAEEPPRSTWVRTDRIEALERVLLEALKWQIQAALAGPEFVLEPSNLRLIEARHRLHPQYQAPER